MKKIYAFIVAAMMMVSGKAQIMISPVIDSAIDGLTENNMAIAESRLRNVISSLGMESGYGGRFILACKISALQREVSGTKLIQHLEINFAIGDNMANACFGSTSIEAIGIGNTEGQAMTSALKNIKSTPQLKSIVAEAQQRIINYYEENASAIIMRAQGLVTAQKWEEALWELTAIPQECSSYPKAQMMMEQIYETHLNHDAHQLLNQAQAIWSADPNLGWSADEAMRILGQINTDADCYPQAQALMRKIESRVTNVTDQRYHDAVAMEKARLNAATAVTKARIKACRDVAVAYAQNQPKVIVRNNYYRSWW